MIIKLNINTIIINKLFMTSSPAQRGAHAHGDAECIADVNDQWRVDLTN